MKREKLEKELVDKIKRYQEEIKERGAEMIRRTITRSFTHQKCISLETQKFGSFSILSPCGDEEVCCLLLCNRCQVYYLDCYHDQFIGDGDFTFQQQITSKEAEIVKGAISKCENPHNKHCRCKYHEKLGEILYRDFMEFLKKENPDFYYRVIPDGIREVVKEVVSKCENPSDTHCSCAYHQKLRKIDKEFLIFLEVENPNLYYCIFPEEKEIK